MFCMGWCRLRGSEKSGYSHTQTDTQTLPLFTRVNWLLVSGSVWWDLVLIPRSTKTLNCWLALEIHDAIILNFSNHKTLPSYRQTNWASWSNNSAFVWKLWPEKCLKSLHQLVIYFVPLRCGLETDIHPIGRMDSFLLIRRQVSILLIGVFLSLLC